MNRAVKVLDSLIEDAGQALDALGWLAALVFLSCLLAILAIASSPVTVPWIVAKRIHHHYAGKEKPRRRPQARDGP